MAASIIIGCGDVGCRVGRRLAALGESPTGLVRTSQSAQKLTDCGISPLQIDLDTEYSLQNLSFAEARIYYFAPPPAAGDFDTRMQQFLEHSAIQSVEKIVYISTSGVYGDCGGSWVNEDQPTNPCTGRAIRRLHAEQLLQTFREKTGIPIVILRVGGIYGPGRLPVVRIPQMTVICPEEAPYSNRIHADDLATVCLAAVNKGESGGVYNAADDCPTSMTDYLYSVADMAGIARPKCVPLAQAKDHLSPGMLSFIQESRRLDTRRMREDLGVNLKYPSLKEGLPSCFQTEA